MKTYQEFCEVIAKQLFEVIEQNGSLLSWHKNWDSSGSKKLPIGAGGIYHGSNLLSLFFSQNRDGFKSNQWLTFNQVRQRGGSIKKGAKGHQVCFWKLLNDKTPVENEQDAKKIPLFKFYYVFNLEQTTLDASMEVAQLFSSQMVDDLITRLAVTISHFGGQSYYNPLEDVIVLPEQKHFKSERNYFSVLLHELVHWTGGRRDRMPRECFDRYDKSDKDRAQEELIAEVGSLFLTSHFGLQGELENHASYVQGWKKHLSEKEVMAAVTKATKAFEWILDHAYITKKAAA